MNNLRIIVEVIVKTAVRGIKAAFSGLRDAALKLLRATKKIFKTISQEARSTFKKINHKATRTAESIERAFNRAARGTNRLLRKIKVIKAKLAGSLKGSFFGKISSIAGGLFKSAFSLTANALASIDLIGKISEIQRLKNSLISLEGGADQAEKAFNRLKQIANQSVYSFQDVANTYSQLRGLFSQDVAATLTQQLLQISGALGLSSEQAESLTRAISQAFGKGTLQAEELNQMLDASPAFVAKLAQALGMTSAQFRQMVNAGKISASQLKEAIGKLAQDVGQPAQTIGQVFSKAFDTIAFKIYEIGQKFGIWDAIIKGVQTLTQWIDKGADALQKLIDYFKGLEATKTLIDNIKNGIRSFIESFKSGVKSAGGDLQNFSKYIRAVISLARSLWNIIAKALGPVLQWLGKVYGKVFGFALGITSRVARKLVELYVKILEFIKGTAELYNRFADKIGWKTIDTSGLKSKIQELKDILKSAEESPVSQTEPEETGPPPGSETIQEPIIRESATQVSQDTSSETSSESKKKDKTDLLIEKSREFRAKLRYYYQALKEGDITHEQFLQKLRELSEEYAKFGVNVEKNKEKVLSEGEANKSTLDIIEEKIRKTDEFISRYEGLSQALENNKISTEEYKKALEELKEIYSKLGVDVENAMALAEKHRNKYSTNLSNALKQTLNQLENMAVNQATQIGMEIGKAIMGSGSVSLRQFGQQFIAQLTSILTQSLMAINPILGVMAALIGGILQGMMSVSSANVNQTVQQNINVVINIGEAVINDKEYWERWLERVFVPSLERTMGQEESRG